MKPDALSLLELAQLIVSVFGFATALREWRFIWILTRVGHSRPERILVNHTILIEVLRCTVHLLVMVCAVISLVLPSPPPSMPGWVTFALVVRNTGWFGVSVIAMLGTWSSRQTRLRMVRELGVTTRTDAYTAATIEGVDRW